MTGTPVAICVVLAACGTGPAIARPAGNVTTTARGPARTPGRNILAPGAILAPAFAGPATSGRGKITLAFAGDVHFRTW